MQEETKSVAVHENLDTSYVNLGALLRYLQGREFVGRVHVELDEYDADIFLNAGEVPRVRETDHSSGREGEGAEALRRLLVRASMPGGLVSVYEGVDELNRDGAALPDTNAPDETGRNLTPEEQEWRELLRLSGELIGAVERAASNTGADFNGALRASRLELADDYHFLDPSTGRFQYANSNVRLQAQPGLNEYVLSLAECLRRTVDKLAKGERGGRVRERVALELAVLARRRQSRLVQFKLAHQLDRIAGAKVF